MYLWALIGELPLRAKEVARFTSYERANEYVARSRLVRPVSVEGSFDLVFRKSSLLRDYEHARIVKIIPEGTPVDPTPP